VGVVMSKPSIECLCSTEDYCSRGTGVDISTARVLHVILATWLFRLHKFTISTYWIHEFMNSTYWIHEFTISALSIHDFIFTNLRIHDFIFHKFTILTSLNQFRELTISTKCIHDFIFTNSRLQDFDFMNSRIQICEFAYQNFMYSRFRILRHLRIYSFFKSVTQIYV
jgi:hypothetical protein